MSLFSPGNGRVPQSSRVSPTICAMRLARVNCEDVAANERQRSGYQEYVRDHPEEAKRFGIKEPRRLVAGELVAVTLDENKQAAIYALHEIGAAALPSVASTERELRAVAMPAPTELPTYLRLGDLARRWHYTKQGAQKFVRREDFPPAVLHLQRRQGPHLGLA